jgi:hypothetical protein
MNYRDIYNSFLLDLDSIQRNYSLTDQGQNILGQIKSKLEQYLRKTDELANLEKLKNNLDYYTVDYTSSFRELRRRLIYKLGELVNLGDEIEKLIYALEKEKRIK